MIENKNHMHDQTMFREPQTLMFTGFVRVLLDFGAYNIVYLIAVGLACVWMRCTRDLVPAIYKCAEAFKPAGKP